MTTVALPGRRSRPALGNRVLCWALFLLVFYASYRYPLQINFSGTSPTYSDTPTSLQVGKFLIAFSLCVVAVMFGRTSAKGSDHELTAVLFIPVALLSIAKFVFLGEYRFIEPILWPTVAGILCFYSRGFSLVEIRKYILVLFYVSVVVEVMQVGLFVTIGRLPALAYENSFSVRFGSFLDDPNAFSGLCFLFLGWALEFRSRWPQRAMGACAVVMIALTQSLTAIGFLCIVLIAHGFRVLLRSGWRTIPALFVIGGIFSMVDYSTAIDIVTDVIESKQSSIETHTKHSLAEVLSGGVPQLLAGSTNYEFYESWWNLSLTNFGIPWALFYLLLILWTLYRLACSYRSCHHTESRAVYMALFMYVAYFLFGSFNLPFFIVFPNTFLFFVVAFLTLGRKLGLPVEPRIVGHVH